MGSCLDPHFDFLIEHLSHKGQSFRTMCTSLEEKGVKISHQAMRSWYVRRIKKIEERTTPAKISRAQAQAIPMDPVIPATPIIEKPAPAPAPAPTISADKAQLIIHALSEGLDPDTGEVISDIGVFHRPHVIRALFKAAIALSAQIDEEMQQAPTQAPPIKDPRVERAENQRLRGAMGQNGSSGEALKGLNSPTFNYFMTGKVWTPEEEAQLMREFRAGDNFVSMSHAHARKVGGITSRLDKMGLIDDPFGSKPRPYWRDQM